MNVKAECRSLGQRAASRDRPLRVLLHGQQHNFIASTSLDLGRESWGLYAYQVKHRK